MNTSSCTIRLATPDDVSRLPEIERLAGIRFREYPELGIPDAMYNITNSVETFAAAQEAGHLWVAVAGNDLAGFALATDIAGYSHLEEIDVLPAHGGRGIGSALLTTVCSRAKESGYPAVTLRTFRDVPWNAPFYQRRGFRIVDGATLSAAHAALEASEQLHGLRTDLRVTMAREMVR